ncbi:MAG TPA: AI-2E family transporter [Dehalococcoidia bacterium]
MAITARRIRFALVLGAVLLVAFILYQARGALLPFVIGTILAYILSPLVDRIAEGLPFYRRRQSLARVTAIFLLYGVIGALLTLAGFLIVPQLVEEGSQFIDDAPAYIERAQEELDVLTERYRASVPPEVQEQIDQVTADLGNTVGDMAAGALSRTLGILTHSVAVILGYLVIPFWLFYLLKDGHNIQSAVEALFPEWLRDDVANIFDIVNKVLGSYIRAQLILAVYIGTITTVGLFIMGVEFYLVLGLVAGITELVPVIGPILGAIPALIVVLATDPGMFPWVLLFYIAVQQTENLILVPRIQGNAVNMHPALIIVMLVIAQSIAGFFGMIVAVPLAAVARDVFLYVYRRLKEEEGLLEPGTAMVLEEATAKKLASRDAKRYREIIRRTPPGDLPRVLRQEHLAIQAEESAGEGDETPEAPAPRR